MNSEDCDICYTHPENIDDEHLIVPIRELAFLVINGGLAFELLELKGHKFNPKELKIMREMFDKYAPHIHYNSSGRFYDKTDEEIDKFKFKHKSYM